MTLNRIFKRKDIATILEGASWSKIVSGAHYFFYDKELERRKKKQMEDAIKTAEKEFISWLPSAVAPSAVDEIKQSYRAINTVLVQKKAITQPLVSITQIGQVENALRLSKKIFGSKKTRATAQKLLTAFLAFLREKKKPELEKNSTPKIDVQEDWIKFDFTNSDQFERTVPAYCSVDGIELTGKNWTEILVGLVEIEIEKQNLALEKLYKKPLLVNRKNRPFFMKSKIEGLSCIKLSNNYWLNVNYSIPRLMEVIRAFCLSCGYNKSQIILFGIPKRTCFSRISNDKLSKPDYGDISDFENVLEECFVKGFRLGSSLEMRKFKRCYKEINGKELAREESETENILRSCGIVYEDKVFMPKTMLSDVIKEKLLRFIADSFNNGKASIYYEAIFKEFSEDFLDHFIYNAEMLKAYLIYVNDGTYHIGRNQITKEAGAPSCPIDEVRGCLKDHGRPMETDKLCETLSHLPRNNVVAILGSNLEFVRNSKGEYFHADVMSLSEEELENIAEIIADAIQSHNFISGTELVKAIKAKYPYTYEAYAAYSDIAWRDALKYKIGSRFSFKGNIISAIGSTLSMTDVFGDLAANAEQLSMDELLSFADEMGSVIYFDAVYDNALRVKEDLFVSKKQAGFQVKETDTILDRLVTGSYLPLKDVTVFGIFPDAGFAWNIYLLESYVASYSEKYALIHGGFNRNCAVGAIVKRSAGYQDLDDLIVDALADSNINLNKPNALDYLVKNGYIARRTYSGIEGLLIRANAKRQTGRRT